MKLKTKKKISAFLCLALMMFGALDVSSTKYSRAEEPIGVEPVNIEDIELLGASGTGTTYTFTVSGGSTVTFECQNTEHPAYAYGRSQDAFGYGTFGCNLVCCYNSKASPFSYDDSNVAGNITWAISYADNLRDTYWNIYNGTDPNGSMDSSKAATVSSAMNDAYVNSIGAGDTVPYSSAWKVTLNGNPVSNNATHNATFEAATNTNKTSPMCIKTGTSTIKSKITVPTGYTLLVSRNAGATYTESYIAGQTAILSEDDYFYLASPVGTADASITVTSCLSDGSQAYYIEHIYVLVPQQAITGAGGTKELQHMCFPTAASPSMKFTVHNEGNGCLAVQKTSASTSITSGSSCYSLQGAVYGVYKTSAEANTRTNAYLNLTTNSSGYAYADNIPCGTYYIRETTASQGFYIDETVYTVSVTPSNTSVNRATANSQEKQRMDPVTVLLKKQDASGTPIEGAQYTFKFYKDVLSDTVPAGSPTRTWIFKTGSNGGIRYENNPTWFVSGDSFYLDVNGKESLPYGTLVIQETYAPDGYELDPTVYVRRIEPGANPGVSAYNMPTVTEKETRADLEFTKKDTNGKLLANVKFEISNGTESHIIWTDENGYYSSKAVAHSNDTNGDKATSGLWFGTTPVDDSQGALPIGTYTIKELRCEANKNTYKNAAPIIFSVTTNGAVYNIGDIIDDNMPKMTSKAIDTDTNINLASSKNKINLKETLNITNLDAGHKYTVKSFGIRKSDGKVLLSDEKKFEAKSEKEGISFTYTLDRKGLEDDDIVFGAELYDEAYPGELVSYHFGMDIEEQTVHIPSIHTTATSMSTNSHDASSKEDEMLRDVVAYKNLVPGKEYEIKTVVMIKNDEGKEEVLLIDGKPIEVTQKFIPTAAEGTVEVMTQVNTKKVADKIKSKDIVFFETVTYNQVEVLIHADIDDKDQTVTIPPIPDTPDTPSTGDSFPMAAILFIGIVSVFGLVILFKKKRQ